MLGVINWTTNIKSRDMLQVFIIPFFISMKSDKKTILFADVFMNIFI